RAIISSGGTTHPQINWNEWHGDKVIYRSVEPGRVNWSLLPEIVVVLEPLLGERVIYNPLAVSNTVRTESDARERVRRIWQDVYGRQPQVVRRTMPLSQVLDSVSAALWVGGSRQEAATLASLATRLKKIDPNELATPSAMKSLGDVLTVFNELQARDVNGEMIPFLRT